MKIKIFFLLFILFISSKIQAQDISSDIIIGKTFKLSSSVLNEDREILVYLPNNYNQTSTRYPVIYILDGNTHFLHAVGTVSFLSANTSIPQSIIVGIPNINRSKDFTPTVDENIQPTGGADNFIKFLEDELIPFMDNNFRTEQFRILFGHSLTGMFSIYTLLSNPDLFDGYIAASPYLMYDDNYVVNLAKKNLRKSYNRNKFLYITLGNEQDYFESMNELTGLLDSESPETLKWEYLFLKNEIHNSIPLKTIYQGLEKIYEGWTLPEDFPQTGNVNLLKEHYENLSDKYGYTIKIPEQVVNLLGYQVMMQGRLNDAVEIFKYNVELYPESANVYDSLGEGLEAGNKHREAKENYSIAYEKGKMNNDPNTELYKQHLDNIEKKLTQ